MSELCLLPTSVNWQLAMFSRCVSPIDALYQGPVLSGRPSCSISSALSVALSRASLYYNELLIAHTNVPNFNLKAILSDVEILEHRQHAVTFDSAQKLKPRSRRPLRSNPAILAKPGRLRDGGKSTCFTLICSTRIDSMQNKPT